MKILIFTEGTILMHRAASGYSSEQIVQQVILKNKSVKDYANYLPIGAAVEKIKEWFNQGAEIKYLTSRKNKKEIDFIQSVLDNHGFPKGLLEYRKKSEKYSDVAERVMPEVLIEDDCESIGGEKETTYYFIKPKSKKMIKSIIVKEFSGIDKLPDSITSLVSHY